MAKVIDGKAIAADLREEIKADTAELVAQGVTPGLAVVLVGEDPPRGKCVEYLPVFPGGPTPFESRIGLFSTGNVRFFSRNVRFGTGIGPGGLLNGLILTWFLVVS